jgi:hypothetical protein
MKNRAAQGEQGTSSMEGDAVVSWISKTKMLKAVAPHNMTGYVDEDLEFPVEAGASGEAFRNNKIVVSDLMLKK